ncbi:MAG TPA: hypothetical protein VKY15_07005 [Acidimicrobiales bacterium]|nr:hypothetical protein [Acidimicrobiales bacterium]
MPPILEVKVPGADIVVEMGGEPWRLRRVRNHPPLALLEPHPRSSPASEG